MLEKASENPTKKFTCHNPYLTTSFKYSDRQSMCVCLSRMLLVPLLSYFFAARSTSNMPQAMNVRFTVHVNKDK